MKLLVVTIVVAGLSYVGYISVLLMGKVSEINRAAICVFMLFGIYMIVSRAVVVIPRWLDGARKFLGY
jgi:hypothetical protein